MSLKELKTTQDTRQLEAQRLTRRFTATLGNRDRSLGLPPRSQVAVQVVINDQHNPLKTHVFKIYPCRHVYYQQAINGRYFYPSFIRVTKGMAYYGLLLDTLGATGITTIAQQKH